MCPRSIRSALALLLFLPATSAWGADDDLLERARGYLDRDRYAQQESELRAALRADPASPRAHLDLGRVLAARGRHGEAVAEYERALELDPELPGIHRRLGTSHFALGDHERAWEELQWAVAEEPDDGSLLLWLGLTELKLDRATEAARHFERAGQADSGLALLALYNAAVAHARAGNPSAASKRLQEMLALDPHPLATQRAQALLDRLEPRRRPWSLRGNFGFLYDDNVTTRELDASSGRADGAGVVELGGSYRALDDGVQRLEGGYDFHQTAHFHESDFDLQTHGLFLSGSRSLGGVDAALGYRYTLATLGGDFFLGFHELRPSLELEPLPGWHAITGPRFLFKSFEDSDRDAIQHAVGIDSYFTPEFLPELLPSGSYGVLGLRFESEEADASRYDYLGFATKIGLHAPFQIADAGYAIDFGYRFHLKDYAHVTPSIGKKRLDAIHATRVRLSRELTESAQLRLDYEFTNSDSNLPSVDYRQNALTVSVAFSL